MSKYLMTICYHLRYKLGQKRNTHGGSSGSCNGEIPCMGSEVAKRTRAPGSSRAAEWGGVSTWRKRGATPTPSHRPFPLLAHGSNPAWHSWHSWGKHGLEGSEGSIQGFRSAGGELLDQRWEPHRVEACRQIPRHPEGRVDFHTKEKELWV